MVADASARPARRLNGPVLDLRRFAVNGCKCAQKIDAIVKLARPHLKWPHGLTGLDLGKEVQALVSATVCTAATLQPAAALGYIAGVRKISPLDSTTPPSFVDRSGNFYFLWYRRIFADLFRLAKTAVF
jgi:hypothetical protein